MTIPVAIMVSAALGFYSRGVWQPLTLGAGNVVRFHAEGATATGVLTSDVVIGTSGPNAIDVLHALPGFLGHRPLRVPNALVATFTTPLKALAAANALHGEAGIRYAHPDFILPKNWRGATDEPLFSSQWHLQNRGEDGARAGADIRALEAWTHATGRPETLIAVIDGGFETAHPDMALAWAVNPGEIAGNGVDDDHNGYVDDVLGWNYFVDTADVDDGLIEDHGAAVAGVAGARMNGLGLTGVCPDCKLLPIVASWQASDDAEAMMYAMERGAAVITNSWGYELHAPVTDVIVDAIDTVTRNGRGGKGSVVLFAMSNIDQDDCAGDKPDISSLATVIAVSASSDLDKKVKASGHGPCMEILAPSWERGRGHIATTDLTSTRGYNRRVAPTDFPDLDYTKSFGGTSASTPMVAGVFGLVFSVNPELTRAEATAIVLGTTAKIDADVAAYDPITGMSVTHGFGRVDAAAAVAAARAAQERSRP